jgi:hypothetical protein
MFHVSAGWIGHDAVSTVIGEGAADTLIATGSVSSSVHFAASYLKFAYLGFYWKTLG